MKKVVALLATAVACMAMVAGTANASLGGVVVARGFACGVLDGNGNIVLTTNSRLTVYANQQSAKVVLQCEKNTTGTGVPGLVKNFNYGNTGAACGMPFFLPSTLDWNNKVGYAGNSQLTCTLTVYGPTPDFSAEASGTAGIG